MISQCFKNIWTFRLKSEAFSVRDSKGDYANRESLGDTGLRMAADAQLRNNQLNKYFAGKAVKSLSERILRMVETWSEELWKEMNTLD